MAIFQKFLLPMLIVLVVTLPRWVEAQSCTHYAADSPQGVGDHTSEANAGDVSTAWAKLSAGDTLCLVDGTYTGANSMIEPPNGMSGTAGNPITVKALNDGGATLNGQFARQPVALYQNDWFVLEGFNAHSSNNSVVHIAGPSGGGNGSDNVIVRRVVAWDAPFDSNSQVFDVDNSQGVLLEDVAGFGSGRKTFVVYRSDDVILRRAWGRWEGSNRSGPKEAFSLSYRSYDVIGENLIAFWTGGLGGVTDQLYGALSRDRLEANDDPWEDPDRNFAGNVKLLGSIAYVPATASPSPGSDFGGVFLGGMDFLELIDVVSYVNKATTNTFSLVNCGSCTGPVDNLTASNLTAIGGDGSARIESQWAINNIDERATVAQAANIYTNPTGSRICYNFVDGTLTSEPLWPWPMNQRIIDAMTDAGVTPVDVTATIESIFGTIPAECRSDAQGMNPGFAGPATGLGLAGAGTPAFPGISTGVGLTGAGTPAFPGPSTGISLTASATPPAPGNSTGLSLTGNATPPFPGIPTGLGFP